jgi:hypothetical protein
VDARQLDELMNRPGVTASAEADIPEPGEYNLIVVVGQDPSGYLSTYSTRLVIPAR